MRSVIFVAAAVVVLVSAWTAFSRAALEPGPARLPTTEVIVFEHADSVHCRIFRRDVLPRYQQSLSVEVPLRFVDLAKAGTASFDLKSRIDTVPTAVVMKHGREVDRIVGYWGPTNFFILLSHILARVE